MLAVKENQKNLYAEISEYFEDEEFLKEIKNGAGYKKTQEKSHSRTEIREYYQRGKDSNRKKILYKQPAIGHRVFFKGSTPALVSRDHALAFRRNV